MNDLVKSEINEEKLLHGDSDAERILTAFADRIIESEEPITTTISKIIKDYKMNGVTDTET